MTERTKVRILTLIYTQSGCHTELSIVDELSMERDRPLVYHYCAEMILFKIVQRRQNGTLEPTELTQERLDNSAGKPHERVLDLIQTTRSTDK
jgi:hypothetical protein